MSAVKAPTFDLANVADPLRASNNPDDAESERFGRWCGGLWAMHIGDWDKLRSLAANDEDGCLDQLVDGIRNCFQWYRAAASSDRTRDGFIEGVLNAMGYVKVKV